MFRLPSLRPCLLRSSRILWRHASHASKGLMNTREEKVTIVLKNGRRITADAIFALHFSTGPASVTIYGWKEDLHQTEDTFEIHEIDRIDFPH